MLRDEKEGQRKLPECGATLFRTCCKDDQPAGGVCYQRGCARCSLRKLIGVHREHIQRSGGQTWSQAW
ncbi:hypothetical protein BV20DRAFT_576146 [Pilatotrama ljubarskyi]|nr:hypothetical protein BV20DRAFT_576146 [Pilatotrama ljubarskyi]